MAGTEGSSDARAQRLQAGMVVGALLATAFVAAGTLVGLSERGLALVSILLLCLGAACAGATFAIIAGDGPRSVESTSAAATAATEAGSAVADGSDKEGA
jgi:hypothetical protein